MNRLFLAIVACFVLSGCTSWRSSARVNPQTVAVYAPVGPNASSARPGGSICSLVGGLGDTHLGAINLDCLKFPEESAGGRYAYDLAAGGYGDDNLAKIYRDRLSSLLIKHADDVCVVEKGRLLATQTSTNFLLSLATTGLSAASTIVVGERAKTILSGLAAVSSGTQDNVNATFYRNQLTQAIGAAMDKERARIRTELAAHRAETVTTFNVDDMIRLTNDYHQACSFEKGLQLLLDAAVDSDGASAALQSRSRQAAIVQLSNYVRNLEATTASAGARGLDTTTLQTELDEARRKLHGLMLATTEDKAKGDSSPDAAPAVPALPAPGEAAGS